jgi:SOS response regulatory protein OraA/RecX
VLKPNKKISHLETKKHEILVWFEDGEKLILDPTTYTDQYLYVGKSLSELEYSLITSSNELAPLKQYAFQLVQRGFYTEKQMRIKLYAREAKRHQVEAIISLLKQYQLVDDARWLEEHVQYGHEKKWGQHKIVAHCLEKGIEENQVKTIQFDGDLEKEKANYHLKKWFQYKGLSFLEKKQKFYLYLVGQGFESSVIHHLIQSLPEKNRIEEKTSFKSLYQKLVTQYGRKEKGFKLKQKIIQSLLRKGYNYNDITAWIGDQDESID